MGKYASLKILRFIYFAVLTTTYPTVVLPELRVVTSFNEFRIYKKKKTIRIIEFQPRNLHTSPIFKQNSTLEFKDEICLDNILFVGSSLNILTLYVNIHGLVFAQMNITVKRQVLHR